MGILKTIKPGNDDRDRRLDRVIRKAYPGMSLGEIYKAIRKGFVTIGDKKVRPDYRIKQEDILWFHSGFSGTAPGVQNREKKSGEYEIIQAPAPGGILMESDDFLVLNKQPGILVHGEDSLEIKVREYLADRISPSLSFRPGPLHRLDRNTSGIIFFGKTLEGSRLFSRLLRENRVEKYYLALLDGHLSKPCRWDDVLLRSEGKTRVIQQGDSGTAGKQAGTTCTPLYGKNDLTLALLQLHTGRTHQIRVQASHHGHPLTEDRKYGQGSSRYFLHAWLLRLQPVDGLPKGLTIQAPLPSRFLTRLEKCFPGRDFKKILNQAAESILQNENFFV